MAGGPDRATKAAATPPLTVVQQQPAHALRTEIPAFLRKQAD